MRLSNSRSVTFLVCAGVLGCGASGSPLHVELYVENDGSAALEFQFSALGEPSEPVAVDSMQTILVLRHTTTNDGVPTPIALVGDLAVVVEGTVVYSPIPKEFEQWLDAPTMEAGDVLAYKFRYVDGIGK